MSKFKIQKIWQDSYDDYCQSGHPRSEEQRKTSRAILACKSGKLGVNVSECSECGHMEFHNNSCRNRNCPICQAVLKEIWVDKRSPGSSRCSIPGTRNWTTMSTCTASSPVEGLLLTTGSGSLP